MLYHLGYVSTQTRPLLKDDLKTLVRVAAERNQSLNITGLLLHREDSFFQVLEGQADSVREVFASIQGDSRHHRIKVLFEGPTEMREFADWRMGFMELDGVNMQELPGLSDYLSNQTDPRLLLEELSETKRLILLFRAMQ